MVAVADYTSLQAQLVRRSHGSSSDDYAQTIREAIEAAEAEMNYGLQDPVTGEIVSGLRVPEMVARALLVANRSYEQLPTDFLALRQVSVVEGDSEYPTGPVPEDGAGHGITRLAGQRVSGYHLQGRQIRLVPGPTSTANIRVAYYAKVPPLAEANPCTAVLETYPHLYTYGGLRHLAAWNGDAGMFQVNSQLFVSAIRAANKANRDR